MSQHEGDLRVSPLPLVLQRIAGEDSTGILTIQGEVDIVAVSFLDGAVVAADALNQTVEDGLGAVLARRSLISPTEFQALAAEHQGGGEGSLGDMIVRRGLVTRDQLLEALREQTSGLLLELMSWEEGEYKFYPGDEVSYEEGTVPLTVEEVLVGAIAAGDGEEPQADLPDIHAVYRALPPSAPVRTIDDEDHAEGDHVLWLTQDEMRLWRLADGVQSAQSVAVGMDVHKLQYALHRLLNLELVELAPTAQAMSQRVGAAEIFMPPDPRQRVGGAIDSQTSISWIRRVGWFLAAVIALALGAQLWTRPASVLMPLPWHSPARVAHARQVQQSLFQKIERANQAYYLMERRYPGSLVDLVDLSLLSPRELTAPTGQPLAFSSDDVGYSLAVRGASARDAGLQVEIGPEDWLFSEQIVEEQVDVPALYLID